MKRTDTNLVDETRALQPGAAEREANRNRHPPIASGKHPTNPVAWLAVRRWERRGSASQISGPPADGKWLKLGAVRRTLTLVYAQSTAKFEHSGEPRFLWQLR